MSIPNLFKNTQVISFEIFPPKEGATQSFDSTLEKLAVFKPSYISVTYGAGGSNSVKNIEISKKIPEICGCPALAHLTCVGSTPEFIDTRLDEMKNSGIHNVLALRGDIPKDMDPEKAFIHYKYASDLVKHIVKKGGFDIAAACYPETHYQSDTLEQDIEALKYKVDCGVSWLVTQMFFDNEAFYRFLDRARAAGINVPISCGIMPVFNAAQIYRMTTMSAASIPASLSKLIARYGEKPDQFQKAGLDFACRQITELVEAKVDGIHLYTMNKPDRIAYIIEQTDILQKA